MEYLILEQRNSKKSKLPAQLDMMQSLTGLALGAFIMAHILFVSAILAGPAAAYWVDKMLEASFLDPTGHGYPALTSLAAFVILVTFVIHAALAVRKFPASWKRYRILKDQIDHLKHDETHLWWYQVQTGFILFFAGSAHVISMMFNPGQIGPFQAAQRYYTHHMWIFYLILLWAVVIHASIGIYRALVKWGWLPGDVRRSRKVAQTLRRIFAVLYLIIGSLSIIFFVRLGMRLGDEPIRFEPFMQFHHQLMEKQMHHPMPEEAMPLPEGSEMPMPSQHP
ncbi:MAG: hypothetical protein A2508_05995 [Candidatus Lambdaproteobacteria bacterium RIFOXYD12_FULL_49_8]|uniref:Fumarate reductase cytochrome b subunit n=1 Tax=Candidatus Lambdaproteobacteria bacterium RIFOXYD2_FULL_50_16 TaxID=1817772 RepID=A0A1F6G6H1_9PROT|nr:MAG: hypothetical protein A2527_11310 [Candidatus Lambdaproteobacteria bacterium RIFOXYD2_FULL_50_16]OGG96386.1 MAG: hypothetical protein A2508_05995 [Candidatus Lambdaproteobacteria bacterium RIFOXYD12_FULL_49_8]